ncbi:MAG: Stp1/IreP family PP2C-type Ser/Thr phosphatase [Clostridia bacterium]|nr:Stp1/IreP family PP2C-type Ser/Thr phosphatase [Clostridia bacterium]
MKVFALSDKGRVRAINQDAYYEPRPGETFAVIADGMGGHQAGDVASRLAIEEFTRWLKCAPRPSEDTLRYAVSEANRAVYLKSRAESDKAGMGTTLTALWLEEDGALLAHVGDSRAYRLRDGRLEQMTHDHSLVSEMMERGELTEEEARVHPQRHYITRAIGTGNRVEADIMRYDRREGDVWLLCSDGLSMYFSRDELQSALRGRRKWQMKVEDLVRTAIDRGGADNVTALLVVCDGGRL